MLQDRYNLSVPSTLLRVFRLPTMRQIQRLTPTELALGARGPRFESGRPDQRRPQASRDRDLRILLATVDIGVQELITEFSVWIVVCEERLIVR